MHEAADMTAAIINITSIGGAVGCNPNPKVSIANPTPPITPNPMPPKRAPIIIAVSTNANCSIICFLIKMDKDNVIQPIAKTTKKKLNSFCIFIKTITLFLRYTCN